MTPTQPLNSASQELSAFRRQVQEARNTKRVEWEASRQLITPAHLWETIQKLRDQVRTSKVASDVHKLLEACLNDRPIQKPTDLNGESLKMLTGLPPAKALRALCVYFGVTMASADSQNDAALSAEQLEAFLGNAGNPYDLLLEMDAPSLLDLGAGDLSFEEELVDRYAKMLRKRGSCLTLHATDRLEPGSKLGGAYHADRKRLDRLRGYDKAIVQFRFWGGTNMMDFLSVKGRNPSYSIVTCHAPANPTFAFEPTRLSNAVITTELQQRKGRYREAEVEGESALEVFHEGRTLAFPRWKFEICGPVALLRLMAHVGKACLLTAVDAEVFWETLAQLLADEEYRPQNEPFTTDNLPIVFGPIYRTLNNLAPGDRVRLHEIAPLRTALPPGPTASGSDHADFRFRWIEIRRGAVFADIPASFTARQFPHMREELPPWCITLIPERVR